DNLCWHGPAPHTKEGAAMSHVSAGLAGRLHPWGPFLTRRDLLRVGPVAVAGALGMEALGSTGPAGGRPRRGTARSVIVLWMAGGVTHLDSFDPKPDAPAEIRGTLGAISTALVGVRFSETMPCLARAAKHLALVRSFGPGNDDHFLSQALALSGRQV